MKNKYQYRPEDEPFKPIYYYDDKLKISDELGYPSLKSGIIATYVKTGSMRTTGRIFGVGQQAIHGMLKKFGIERNKVGGPNRRRAATYLRHCRNHGMTEFYERCHICCQCKRERTLAAYWKSKNNRGNQ